MRRRMEGKEGRGWGEEGREDRKGGGAEKKRKHSYRLSFRLTFREQNEKHAAIQN